MIEESIEEPPEEPKIPKESLANLSSNSCFQEFVNQLRNIDGQNLKFSECNKFLKLKHTDYMTDEEVIHYFKELFSKKTSMTVRRKWHIKDKFILVWVVFKLCHLKGIQNLKMKYSDWQTVEEILHLPKEFLMRKWICMIRHTTYHFHWTQQQEETLKRNMKGVQSESKWSDLAIAIYKQSESSILRTCKDIREHWKNYLDPNLKKQRLRLFRAVWSFQEDEQLTNLIQTYGKKWSMLSKMILGRTENQVKNRYLALLKKKMKMSSSQNSKSIRSQESFEDQEKEEREMQIQMCRENQREGQRDMGQGNQRNELQLSNLLQNYTAILNQKKDFYRYDTIESVGAQELEDYIHMQVFDNQDDDGFFSDG